MITLSRTGLTIAAFLLAASPLLAQPKPTSKPAARPAVPQTVAKPATPQATTKDDTGGQVLMLEEIRIEVAPELPTVIISIPRQKPEINSVSLVKSANDLITAGSFTVKPRLADLRLSQLEDTEKMLAKARSQ